MAVEGGGTGRPLFLLATGAMWRNFCGGLFTVVVMYCVTLVQETNVLEDCTLMGQSTCICFGMDSVENPGVAS